MAKFEIALPPTALNINGWVNILERESTKGHEEFPDITPPPDEGLSNMIIQTDQPFFARFQWRVTGLLTRMLGGGSWKCDLLFEAMGVAETGLNPFRTVADVGVSGHWYKADVDVPAFALNPGVYRVIARLQYYDSNGKPGPIAGFDEAHVVQIYKDE